MKRPPKKLIEVPSPWRLGSGSEQGALVLPLISTRRQSLFCRAAYAEWFASMPAPGAIT